MERGWLADLLADERPTPTLLGTRPPLPVLVCRNGNVVGDAVVVVSERDPNWCNGEIRVNSGDEQ